MGFLNKRLRWIGLGAMVGWLFDPVHGRERRARVSAVAEKVWHRTRKLADRGLANVPAPVARRVDQISASVIPFVRRDDRALVERVRREALDPLDAAHLLVRAHRGRVAVGGALAGDAYGTDLEMRIAQIPGVVSVEIIGQRAAEH